jgi:hypothetical protein
MSLVGTVLRALQSRVLASPAVQVARARSAASRLASVKAAKSSASRDRGGSSRQSPVSTDTGVKMDQGPSKSEARSYDDGQSGAACEPAVPESRQDSAGDAPSADAGIVNNVAPVTVCALLSLPLHNPACTAGDSGSCIRGTACCICGPCHLTTL